MNPYTQVFIETLWAASIVPMASETAFFAMKAFGGFDMNLALTLAVIGSTLGLSVNWLIGRMAHTYAPPIADKYQATVVFGIVIACLSLFFIATGYGMYTYSTSPSKGITIGAYFLLFFYIAYRFYVKYQADPQFYARHIGTLRRYGVIALLFSWAPMCNFLSLIAGFAGIRYRVALPFIVLGQLGYFASVLM